MFIGNGRRDDAAPPGTVCERRVCLVAQTERRLYTRVVQVWYGVEFGHSTLGGGVKAFGFATHLEEDLLLLELPRELLLQCLQGAADTNNRVNLSEDYCSDV